MKIWVDADATPAVVKEILFRAAERKRVSTMLVANRLLRVPPSPYITALQVPQGFDVADNEIARRVDAGDLVITADIPLAAQVIEKGGHALNPRGEFYSRENIREALNLRDFMAGLRDAGLSSSGPPAYAQSDRQAFANQLDRFLAKLDLG
jgi:uncharacterized protein YaiI (UPF0178 family)